MAGTYNKDERIPSIKLTVMQYIIAAILVILLVGIFMALRRRRIRLDAEAPP